MTVPSSAPEGDDGTTSFTFSVVLSHPSDAEIQVGLSTFDDLALTVDNDYIAVASHILVFPPETTTQNLPVEIVGDNKVESDETLSVVGS